VKERKKTVRDWEKAIERNERGGLEKQRREKRKPPLNTTVRWRDYRGKRKEWNGRRDN